MRINCLPRIDDTNCCFVSNHFVSYLVNNADVQAVSIDGIAPTLENTYNGTYLVWGYEHMYTKGKATGETKSFLKYMESSKVQKKTVEKLGYISVSDMKVTKDADGNVTKK